MSTITIQTKCIGSDTLLSADTLVNKLVSIHVCRNRYYIDIGLCGNNDKTIIIDI